MATTKAKKVVAAEANTTTETTTTTIEKEKKVFDSTEQIRCRSITQGGLYIEGEKSGTLYEWHGYGDETTVEYRDLAAMVRAKSKYVFNPNFIVEDDEFIAEFAELGKFYKANYSVKEIRNIFALPIREMLEELKALPETVMDTAKSIASTEVSSGRIDSVKKIKALDELFDTEMNLLAELDD